MREDKLNKITYIRPKKGDDKDFNLPAYKRRDFTFCREKKKQHSERSDRGDGFCKHCGGMIRTTPRKQYRGGSRKK